MEHQTHDVIPSAEKFTDENAKLNSGRFWCKDCQTEFVPKELPARIQ